MGCACKVSKHINKIEQQYGTNIRPSKKTDIGAYIKGAIKKGAIILLLLPFIPLMFVYVLVRNCFTKKTISIDKLFKLKN
jgi:hypothetical protein